MHLEALVAREVSYLIYVFDVLKYSFRESINDCSSSLKMDCLCDESVILQSIDKLKFHATNVVKLMVICYNRWYFNV